MSFFLSFSHIPGHWCCVCVCDGQFDICVECKIYARCLSKFFKWPPLKSVFLRQSCQNEWSKQTNLYHINTKTLIRCGFDSSIFLLLLHIFAIQLAIDFIWYTTIYHLHQPDSRNMLKCIHMCTISSERRRNIKEGEREREREKKPSPPVNEKTWRVNAVLNWKKVKYHKKQKRKKCDRVQNRPETFPFRMNHSEEPENRSWFYPISMFFFLLGFKTCVTLRL